MRQRRPGPAQRRADAQPSCASPWGRGERAHTARAGVVFGAALAIALAAVCLAGLQRTCCPRRGRRLAPDAAGKGAPDVEMGALGKEADIVATPAPTPLRPWPGGGAAGGAAGGAPALGKLSRSSSLQVGSVPRQPSSNCTDHACHDLERPCPTCCFSFSCVHACHAHAAVPLPSAAGSRRGCTRGRIAAAGFKAAVAHVLILGPRARLAAHGGHRPGGRPGGERAARGHARRPVRRPARQGARPPAARRRQLAGHRRARRVCLSAPGSRSAQRSCASRSLRTVVFVGLWQQQAQTAE